MHYPVQTQSNNVICWTDPLGKKNAIYAEEEYLTAAKDFSGLTDRKKYANKPLNCVDRIFWCRTS